ncbi:DNA repair metallo-beta-lactamase-domain-containing protein [Dichotomocladium elegans]|nr:DNA repair metallo-beta-lactamase-domain-containing protein [Dichotomocladium elegans]
MTCATGPKLCPICETVIETKDMEKMNLHINRCLDATARCDQQQQSVTADRNSSLMAGLRQVFAPKDSNIMTAPLSTKGSIEKNPAVEQSCQVKKVTNPGRLCPYYKWMEDTKFTVDAFSYGKIPGCEGYFLSHYHSDHYHGLSKSWSNGPIYCSKVTANLVKQELGVGPHYVMPLALDEKHQLTETVSVTLIDANHCPGSVLFLFEVVPRKGGPPLRHLHTGDFRASPRMCLHPALRQAPINNLYLDTTYLDGHYSFPGQEEVVNAACDHLPQEQPRVLIVVGTYTIGKEKVFLHLARRLKSKVFVKEKKRRILKCQENEELSSLLTDDPYEAQIHVVGMWDLKVVALESYRQTFGSHFSSVLAFRPTGWTFGGGGRGYRATPTSSTPGLSTIIEPPADRSVRLRPDKSSTDNVKVYGIPYSEHSSFRELAAFICSLDIAKIIPTVNMSKPESQHRQYAVLNRWQYEKKVIGIKSVPYPSEDYW